MSLIDMHCEYKKCKHAYPITSHYIDDNGDILEANIAQVYPYYYIIDLFSYRTKKPFFH